MGSAQSTKPRMIKFTEISIKAPLPLHPFLAAHPRLSVALIEDDNVYAETPVVNGYLETGKWEINSSLCANSVKQSVTLAVVASKESLSIRFASVKLSVAELLTRVNAQPDGYQEFEIGNSDSSIKLIITCSVKVSLAPIVNNLLIGTHDNHAVDSGTKNAQSNHGPDSSGLPSREYLESAYAKVVRIPGRDERKARALSVLGCAYFALYQREGVRMDLETAMSLHEEALQCTEPLHPQWAEYAHQISRALIRRFEQSRDIVDIERAISYLQAALSFTEDLDADKPNLLNHLGSALHLRFQRLDNLTDLEDALSSLRKAVRLTPDGHSGKPGQLNNLGNTLRSRFGRLGDLTDLEDAITSLQKAVQLTPDGHPDKPCWLSNLGNVLESRFDCLGSLVDIEDAIINKQIAVQLTPDGHPDKPNWLNNLGNALRIRFGRLGNLTDLEDAISSLQKVVQLTPDGHPDKPGWFNNLGNVLQSRFDHVGDLIDLEVAVLNQRKAVELSPDGHPDKSTLLSNLGVALETRFARIGGLADLEDATSTLRQAVHLTSDGHPEKLARLHNLGGVLFERFRRLGILNDLDSGLSALSAAANSTYGSAMVRFKAARAWAKASELSSRSPLDAFGCAINLLPRIAWLGLAVADQHALLADVGGIVRDAVAAAIRYEEYETAVVWAEQGRSIVWQNFLGLRNPVDDLREAYPELANRLRRIAVHLEGSESHEALGGTVKTASVDDVSQKYTKLALEWEHLVEEIRGIPTFEGFLKAKTFRQLAPAAHDGPVVILNVNDARCDALVLIAEDSTEMHVSAVNIPLERFSHETSKKLFHGLTSLLSSTGVRVRDTRMIKARSHADGEDEFEDILRILWQDIVKPVLEGLSFRAGPKRPPHIWWCATGLLGFLPIHAAGLYDTPHMGEKVSDYVVSSYTPTLNAILELSDPMVQADFQVLAVAQASAPGAQLIPKTEDEVLIIQSLLTSARVLNLTREKATVERVREGMMKSNWIHLACHGQQNPDDPMESGFLLHDKILKLSEIVKMNLPKADFAFLSACQTAMGDEKLAEESVHLAAGMFLSGCRGVIATTWSIRDDDGPMIAQEVYSRMFSDGKPNRKEAAYALHEAVKLLRESGAPCTSWVPFIHIGR